MSISIHYTCIRSTSGGVSPSQDNYCCSGEYRLLPDLDRGVHCFKGISDNQPVLFGVFDGIGGLQHGDAASAAAARIAAGYKLSGNPYFDMNSLCRRCNEEICSYIRSSRLQRCGTTAAMVCYYADTIAVCNVGDSRVYRFSNGELKQLSRDHIMLAGFSSSRKPPLSQYLGLPSEESVIQPEISLHSYSKGDIYIICSDGLVDAISASQLEQTIRVSSPDCLAEALMEAAKSGNSRDNITIIVCRTE